MPSRSPSTIDLVGPRGWRATGTWRALILVSLVALLAGLLVTAWSWTDGLIRNAAADWNATVTVAVPRASETDPSGANPRGEVVRALLASSADVRSVRVVSDAIRGDLTRGLVGQDLNDVEASAPMILVARLAGGADQVRRLAATLDEKAPGTAVESLGARLGDVSRVARAARLIAAIASLVVVALAITVVAFETRSLLASRREAITIIYRLGAPRGRVARIFARRPTALTAVSGALGGVIALLVIVGVAGLLRPLLVAAEPAGGFRETLGLVPGSWWFLPGALALGAGIVGYGSAWLTIHVWLRRYP